MDLVLLKTFLKVATTGSITKTAALLLITQSAVSRRVKQLEDYVGSPLLDRSGTALKPTSAGRMLIDRGRRILEIEEDIFRDLARPVREKISVCCTPSLGTHYLNGLLSTFMARHSDTLDLSCVFTMPEEALAGIDDGTFDLAVLEHCNHLDLGTRPTYPLRDDEVVFISGSGLDIPAGEVSIERLLGERLYLKNRNGCARRFLDLSLSEQGRSCDDFAGVIYFDDLGFLVNEVKAGKGITLVSRELVSGEIEARRLRVHRVKGFNHFRQRSIVVSHEKKTKLTEELIERLLNDLNISLHPMDMEGSRPDPDRAAP